MCMGIDNYTVYLESLTTIMHMRSAVHIIILWEDRYNNYIRLGYIGLHSRVLAWLHKYYSHEYYILIASL